MTKKSYLEIEYQMKDRISYKGLYKLHDHVNFIHKTIYNLEHQIDQDIQRQYEYQQEMDLLINIEINNR